MKLRVVIDVPVDSSEDGENLRTALEEGDIEFNDLPESYQGTVEFEVVLN